jgi:DNA-binding transcriptional regulator YhcF (GntR family)
MKLNEDSAEPLFQQIAEIIEDMIIAGDLQKDEQVFSTNQLSETFQVNPATARKGLNLLVDKGILYKKRGLGMFVEEKASSIIKKERKDHFFEDFLLKTLKEAEKLNINKNEIIKMITNYGEGD